MFKLFKKVFRIKPRNFLGIDIGTSSVRVAEIGKDKHNYYLRNYGSIGSSAFKGEEFRNSQKSIFSLSNENVAEAIAMILEKAGIETKEVGLSIPDFNSFFTNLELPAMNEDEISEAVRYQIRPFVPLSLEDITLDWSIVEGEPSKSPLKILAVAIPKEIVTQYQKVAEIANLELKFLESEVFSLARALSRNRKTEKVICLIDMGAKSTTCSILEGGILKISYTFNVAGSELTKAISRSLNIGYNKAEEIKRKNGLILLESNVPKILNPLVDSILEEVKRVFREFYQAEGKEVNKIILSGGVALMPGLREYFANELKKETVIANPFSGINYPTVLETRLKNLGPVYGIATGLALKGLE